VPPNWWEELGALVVLWDQLMCWQSHHSLVLKGNFSSYSGRVLQSKFISAQPKIWLAASGGGKVEVSLLRLEFFNIPRISVSIEP